MNLLILSAHTDDAVFSVGEHIAQWTGSSVTVATPFAGVPTDPEGRAKHVVLLEEHHTAMEYLGCKYINGPFYDDVYPKTPADDLEGWVADVVAGYDEVWCPLGIHHPDHIQLEACFTALKVNKPTCYYEELPYRVLYPELAYMAVWNRTTTTGPMDFLGYDPSYLREKKAATYCYESQLGKDILRTLFVPERVWRVK